MPNLGAGKIQLTSQSFLAGQAFLVEPIQFINRLKTGNKADSVYHPPGPCGDSPSAESRVIAA
jgi:hypothetical protein